MESQTLRGKISVSAALKIMWGHINELTATVDILKKTNGDLSNKIDNILLTHARAESGLEEVAPRYKLDTNVKQAKSAGFNENEGVLFQRVVDQEAKIEELADEVKTIQNATNNRTRIIDNTMNRIGSDMTEMNTKYMQMNNFLVEIQTTQITVNNQILRQYNENYTEAVETRIEKALKSLEKHYIQELSVSDTMSDTMSEPAADVVAEIIATEHRPASVPQPPTTSPAPASLDEEEEVEVAPVETAAAAESVAAEAVVETATAVVGAEVEREIEIVIRNAKVDETEAQRGEMLTPGAQKAHVFNIQ